MSLLTKNRVEKAILDIEADCGYKKSQLEFLGLNEKNHTFQSVKITFSKRAYYDTGRSDRSISGLDDSFSEQKHADLIRLHLENRHEEEVKKVGRGRPERDRRNETATIDTEVSITFTKDQIEQFYQHVQGEHAENVVIKKTLKERIETAATCTNLEYRVVDSHTKDAKEVGERIPVLAT